MYESPEPDARARFRGAPQVILAVSGVVVATVFAAVASIAAGSSAQPATPGPRKDVVSKDSLSFPSPTSSTSSSVESTTETTTSTETSTSAKAPIKKPTKVTTITRPDGTTTTVPIDETTPPKPTTGTTTTTTEPTPTTTEPTEPTTTTTNPGQ